jgi:tetratricopeptide (TPR) repeat protein
MGVCLSGVGRRGDALACFERALEVLEAAGGANPNTFLFPAASAWMEFARGIELIALGRDEEALVALERARTAREILIRANPAVVRNLSQLAGINREIARVHRRAGRIPQAFESIERARVMAEKLVDSHPDVPEYQGDLAWAYAELGDLHAALYDAGKMLSSFDRAIRTSRHVVEANPAALILRSDLAEVMRRRGAALQRCGRFAQGASDFRESITVLRGLKCPSPSDYYSIACGLSLLSSVASEPGSGLSAAEGQSAADEAILKLRQAAAAGWRDLGLLRRDSDLAPLRSRSDFQSFALDLEFPKNPFAATTP